ncbi:ABC transporter ATP-binding protein [bacterium RCC_150]
MILTAENLVLSYGDKPIVNGASLTIPEGKVTGFLGPNGSGKSTIFRALSRLLKPDAGAVLIDGATIASMSTKAVARQLAILPQQSAAPDSISVEDLVWYGRHPYRHAFGSPSAEDRALVDWALEVTELGDLRTAHVDALSGGQRQRAWIALALAQGTETLLLDEPTTFLDISHQLEVLELCVELNRTQGKTIVMVLHEINQASEYCDHLVVIRKGEIFRQGPPAEVLTQELMKEVFAVDAQIIPHPLTRHPMCITSPRYATKAGGSAAAGPDRVQVSASLA